MSVRKWEKKLRRLASTAVITALLGSAAVSVGLVATTPAMAASSQGQAIVNTAAAEAGTPYCFDGGSTAGPTHGSGGSGCGGSTVGFDCSGLALYAVYQVTGITLPHGAGMQSGPGGQVISSQSGLQPGDLVFFGGGSLANSEHVGVYAGGGMMWDANDYNVPVQEHSLAWEEAAFSFDGGVRYWGSAGGSAGGSGPASPVGNMIQNGSFTNGGSSWQVGDGENLSVYSADQDGDNSYGDWFGDFAATNAPQAGGSLYQDIPVSLSTNNTVCATADVRTSGDTTGGGGYMTMYLIGGGTSGGVDQGSYWFQHLGGGENWKQVEACTRASGPRALIRLQFFPTVNGPTIDIANVDVHKSLAQNGNFTNSGYGWQTWNANFAVYPAGTSGYNSYGDWFGDWAAMNTGTPGGSVYQDIPVSLSTSNTVCATAEVRTSGGATGGGGSFNVYLIGGGTAGVDQGTYQFQNLGNGENWKQIQACASASGPRSLIRIQFFPNVNGPTVDIANVDVHRAITQNGTFSNSGNGWQTMNGANLAVYPAGTSGDNSYGDSSGYWAATNAPQAGGSTYQDIPVSMGTGNTVCATAEVRTSGNATGGSGYMTLYLLGGGTDSGTYWFQNLGNSEGWKKVQACASASGSRSLARIQFYPTNGTTIDIANVDVH